jgi:hypothetical protein
VVEDAVAREQAAVANQKIDSHEDRCSERWREARDEMRLLHARISESKESMDRGHRRLTGWLVAGQGGAIVLLVGALIARVL